MKKKTCLHAATIVVAAAFLATIFNGCGSSNKKEKTVKEFEEFIKAYEAKVIPLFHEYNLASWNAQISGKDADYKKSADLQYKFNLIYSNKDDFAKLKMFKESGAFTDSMQLRQITILYNAYCGNQYDTAKLRKIIDQESAIEKKFNTFRALVGKDSLSDNQVDDILLKSTDCKKLEATWLASKKSGENVAADVIKLVKLRNEEAKTLGFKNYHEMSLELSEEDPRDIEKLFDQLDSLTKDGFAKLKGEVDEYFAKRYSIKKEELMPWHYQNRFFQDAPKIYDIDLDKYYKGKDIVKIVEAYYKSMGMDITEMAKKSDLLEKPGKYQHAQCSDIDKDGDIRVMASIKDNEYWMGTLLHEFGHAVYDKYIDRSMPFTLRDPAHIFTTEAVAEMFGRFSSNPQWIKDMIGISDKEKAEVEDKMNKNLRLQQMVFSRWSQVMYRFEKALYENPDQDLNNLWWTLVEKYQLMKRPKDRNAPDWASKIHLVTSPCYYHNYLMGELLASQMYYYVTEKVLKSTDFKNQSFANKPEAGKFFMEKIFKPGTKYYWNDMIEKATGEKLTAKYYAKQFVD
jgi:peptidyl-dipeptidase A